MDVFPGSLNVILSRPTMLRPENAISFDDGSGLVWRASISDEEVLVFRWRQAPLHVAEVLAEVHLRTALQLRDGDRLTLSIRQVDIQKIPFVGTITWLLFWWGRRDWCYTKDQYYWRTVRWCRLFGATQLGTTKTVWDLVKTILSSGWHLWSREAR